MKFPGLKNIEKGFLRSKVARRIFVLFVVCALLPLLAFASFSFKQVSDQLYRQAEDRLNQESKSTGINIIQRLTLLENTLNILSMHLTKENSHSPDSVFRTAHSESNNQFRGIALVNEGGHVLSSAGQLQHVPDLSPDQRNHIRSGKTLLFTRQRKESPADIYMVKQTGSLLLFSLVSNEFLWENNLTTSSSMTSLILDADQNAIFISEPDHINVQGIRDVLYRDRNRRNFKWSSGSNKHLASYWNIFLPTRFLIKWTVVLSQKESEILSPLKHFNKIFPLIILLSMLIVLLLSFGQIRRYLIPVELLQKAIRKIKENNFDTRLTIASNDEFQELGTAFNDMTESIRNHMATSATINRIGIALSAEKNTGQLMKIILNGAMKIVNADAGILYTVHESGKVTVPRLHIKSLDLEVDSHSNGRDKYNAIVHSKVVKLTESSIFNNVSLNVPDIYNAKGFNFLNNIYFDEMTGYISKSSLSIPMKNHENEIIGVLQLINAQDKVTREIIPFSDKDEKVAQNLASLAAMAMSKNKLLEDFKLLFDSLVKLIATAIDEKSSYAGGHCKRVPELTMMIARAASKSDYGIFKDYSLTEDEMYELKVAALLHDCGKVSVPSHIENKASKLETIFNRIHLLDERFEILKRDAEISFLKNKLSQLKNNGDALEHEIDRHLYTFIEEIKDDRTFLHACNSGREPMNESELDRLRGISLRYTWTDLDGSERNFLSKSELNYLSIPRGTITDEERIMINSHVNTTSMMLDSLHYPKSLRNVPKFARVHHERMDGKGYPHGLSGNKIPMEGRMIAISDIFEALTAHDRPYKRKFTLSESLMILGSMKEDGHIDPDLFDLFVREKLYLKYAEQHLHPDQIDDIDVSKIPGYICTV